MNVASNLEHLTEMAVTLVEDARRAGADAADVVVIRSHSKNVTVRFGKVEKTTSSENDEFALRVFMGRRVASVAANINADSTTLAARAVAMAKVAPENLHEGLAPDHRLARVQRNLDLFDPMEIHVEGLISDALEAEDVALNVTGVTNSDGASSGVGMGSLVLVTSDGFRGYYATTHFGRSVCVIAGSGVTMERGRDFSSSLHFSELENAGTIGRNAGERAVRRLGARKAKTGSVTVVYDPRVARGIAGHLASAINGVSIARKTSFLKDYMGKQVLKSDVNAIDDPLRPRGLSSQPFDGEGVEGQKLVMIENGILQHWFLSCSVASELGLSTNGRGVRSGTSIGSSSTNFAIEPGEHSPDDLIRAVGTGFYVTEVFGQGVNMVTGQYSRGASGFWIENGELTYPVSEVTIASNLKDMFLNMTPASDLNRNFSTCAPTLVIEGMTLAGS